ncbi:MAG: hypothetical protein ABS41_08385 [Arenimonas sp. SCN 70-307]|uniref:hypothetical protein n=1 Tax=Arenimonas sp. SCN 70-307 TaxID=1660089 RepID=UPI0008692BEF|nr:hypothetical protein [Arenimonas sp. SCN 70-307]ODS63168.1 MAG: hypothetical protein ABS41_08385 [Arenimonas sp. SCN 70-307]
MTLEQERKKLDALLDEIPAVGMHALGGSGAPLFILDFIISAAIKRTLNLGHGLLSMIEARNMTCSRALVRMQIDTVSRLLAYTYVSNPEEVAKAVIGGTPLKKFKSREGKTLRDDYLIDRMTETHDWVRTVYNSTSGDVHFSEKQFFASVTSMKDDEGGRSISMMLSQFDTNYPEFSWAEVVACFSELCEILISILTQYGDHKKQPSHAPPPA